ncbi:hypothetical protein ABZ907_37505 [Nonomuraea wenchangensis]
MRVLIQLRPSRPLSTKGGGIAMRPRRAIRLLLSALAITAFTVSAAGPADAADGPGPSSAALPYIGDGHTYALVNSQTGDRLVARWYIPGQEDRQRVPFAMTSRSSQAGAWTFERYDGHPASFRLRNVDLRLCARPGQIDNQSAVTLGSCEDEASAWHAEPQDDGRWRRARFLADSTGQAMRPYSNASEQRVVLGPDSDLPLNWWSIALIRPNP